jgi:hypothetical protein
MKPIIIPIEVKRIFSALEFFILEISNLTIIEKINPAKAENGAYKCLTE